MFVLELSFKKQEQQTLHVRYLISFALRSSIHWMQLEKKFIAPQ